MDQFDLPEWFARHTFHHTQFEPVSDLVAAKRRAGVTISVCIPTRNERATIGTTVRVVRQALVEREPLVDELVVMDAGSTDGTGEAAAAEGATVVVETEVLPEEGTVPGKGDALWKSLYVCSGDVLCWVDADIVNFHPRFVTGVVGPLLTHPELGYVKGFYERPIRQSLGDGVQGPLSPTGGGRVTELLARPLLNAFWPQLAGMVQPLAGEFAGRRELLERVPFYSGHGIEFGLLVDIAREAGIEVIAQVDLERRIHRNQDLQALSRMSFGILQAATALLAEDCRFADGPWSTVLAQFVRCEGHSQLELRKINVARRRPMVTVGAYRTRLATNSR